MQLPAHPADGVDVLLVARSGVVAGALQVAVLLENALDPLVVRPVSVGLIAPAAMPAFHSRRSDQELFF